MTRQYTANDLRDDLSEILAQLKNGKDDPTVVARAESAAKIGKVFTDLAIAEVKLYAETGAMPTGDGFIPASLPGPKGGR